MCGVDETVKNKPFLYLFDELSYHKYESFRMHFFIIYLLLVNFFRQVCVPSCSSESFDGVLLATQIGEVLTKTRMICKDNVTVTQFSVEELEDQGLCASYSLQSKPIKFIPLVYYFKRKNKIFGK
jgi:hypothetical protein